MTTEQYQTGYEEGYQEGWNAAMDEGKVPQRDDTELIRQMLEIITFVTCDSVYEQNCSVCNTIEAARLRLENT